MISVVLFKPEKEENVGAVARVMKNFGFSSLAIVEPQCNHLGGKAMAVASHAKEVLEKARIITTEQLQGFDYLVGTTAILGDDSHVARSPLSPEKAAKKMNGKKAAIGLLFGPESQGLRNEEILKCDFLITVQTSKQYPTLNLSHSVAVVLYELAKGQNVHVSSHIREAGAIDKEVLLKIIDGIIESLEFQTPFKKETQRRVWKKVVGKSMLTKKEALSLMGFFKKIKRKQ